MEKGSLFCLELQKDKWTIFKVNQILVNTVPYEGVIKVQRELNEFELILESPQSKLRSVPFFGYEEAHRQLLSHLSKF